MANVNKMWPKEKELSLYQFLFPNGKRYIGISSNPRDRWATHRRHAQRTNINRPLIDAIRSVPWESISKSVLVIGNRDYILDLEIKAIQAFSSMIPNGYNAHIGGTHGPTVESFTRAHATLRANGKMPAIAKKLWADPEIRAKRLAAGNTPECRLAKGAGKVGKKDSDETRAKKSAALRGKKKSKQHILNLRAVNNSGRKFITDGVMNKFLRAPFDLPVGWRFGMAPKHYR